MFFRSCAYATDLPDGASFFVEKFATARRRAYGGTGLAGATGFGPGASGSIAGFGAVGVTVAPTAFAAALVVP
jgi:hypothetical protein